MTVTATDVEHIIYRTKTTKRSLCGSTINHLKENKLIMAKQHSFSYKRSYLLKAISFPEEEAGWVDRE